MDNNKILTFNDKINETEEVLVENDNDKKLLEKTINKHIRRSKGGHFYTEIEGVNELGEVVFTGHNELLMSGGIFTLMKLANVNSPLDIKTMNADLDINTSNSAPGFTGCRREDAIFGFCCGTSGCTDLFDTVKPVKYKERTITSLVPFRKPKQDRDLTEDEQNRYFMKKTVDDYFEYYVKNFEVEPQIFAVYDEPGSPAVPVNVDELDDDRIINTYVQFVLKISNKDFREWFKISGGGIRKCRINSLALVTGYKEGEDYRGVRAFSKLNFNNEAFDNETKELTVFYRIYI